jgi:CBS domain-containing protein
MKYLTQLLDKKVRAPGGECAGKIVDAVAVLGDRFPNLKAVVLKTDGGEVCVPYDALEIGADPAGPAGTGVIQGDVRLRSPLASIPPYQPTGDDLYLRRDMLDKQIVDVQGHRVVRVSDVRLAEYGDSYCVVGIDASMRAALRRLGAVSLPIEWIAGSVLKRPLRANLIGWDDVHTLDTGTSGGIRLKVSHDTIMRLHPADIADIVEQLSPKQQVEMIEHMDTETAADTIAEAEPETQVAIMQQLDNEMATDILEEMEPDDAADVLDDLPDDRSDELLESMEPEQAEDVRELMAYDDETAGGLMTTEFVAIKENLTCDETIDRLRELAPSAESSYYVYVVDDEERLVGVLSLRDLVIAPPETHVRDIMHRNVIHAYEEDHEDEIAQIIGRYNLLAVPVLSKEERLIGIITVDDTMERLLPPERRRKLPVMTLSD